MKKLNKSLEDSILSGEYIPSPVDKSLVKKAVKRAKKYLKIEHTLTILDKEENVL